MKGFIASMAFISTIFFLGQCQPNQNQTQQIEEAEWVVDEETGLIRDIGMNQVVINCNPCHSSRTVTQFRASREGWKKVIVWMQEEQNLWDLGDFEEGILDYLEKHYSPEEMSFRRINLEEPEWYTLED